MKFLREKKTRAVLVVALAALMPLAFGGGPSSAAIENVTGTSQGIEMRDAKSVSTPTNDIKNGSCTDAPVNQFPLNVTGLASYTYPLPGTVTVGLVSVTGKDNSTPSVLRTYTGPVNVSWQAPTVWDGPSGTTRAMNGTSGTCDYGYEWPVNTASIISGVGAAPGTGISCTSPISGTPGLKNSNGVTGSYYSRPKVNPNNLLNERGQEVIRLVFAGANCSITEGGTAYQLSGSINGSGNNVFTVQDDAHAFCQDLNAAQLNDPPNQVGVTHCASNYTIT